MILDEEYEKENAHKSTHSEYETKSQIVRRARNIALDENNGVMVTVTTVSISKGRYLTHQIPHIDVGDLVLSCLKYYGSH